MFNGSNCDRKSQFSEILTEPLNPRDIYRDRQIDRPGTEDDDMSRLTYTYIYKY